MHLMMPGLLYKTSCIAKLSKFVRDEQLQRYKMTIDELKEQITKTQPELKGEAGEQDLSDSLREAFPED
jgi:hypothetical protein